MASVSLIFINRLSNKSRVIVEIFSSCIVTIEYCYVNHFLRCVYCECAYPYHR